MLRNNNNSNISNNYIFDKLDVENTQQSVAIKNLLIETTNSIKNTDDLLKTKISEATNKQSLTEAGNELDLLYGKFSDLEEIKAPLEEVKALAESNKDFFLGISSFCDNMLSYTYNLLETTKKIFRTVDLEHYCKKKNCYFKNLTEEAKNNSSLLENTCLDFKYTRCSYGDLDYIQAYNIALDKINQALFNSPIHISSFYGDLVTFSAIAIDAEWQIGTVIRLICIASKMSVYLCGKSKFKDFDMENIDELLEPDCDLNDHDIYEKAYKDAIRLINKIIEEL